MKILVTGFEPFGSDAENPTLLAVNALPETLAGARILKRILPVSFQAAQRMVRAAVAQEGVDAAVLTGLAGGRAKVSLERVAINVQDARMPDNDGDCPVDLPIRAEGPAAYFATLPLRRIQAGLQDAGIPVEISNSAGTYVCNLAMYCALDEIALLGLRARAGFIHVPYLPQQAQAHGAPGMPLEEAVRALTTALEILAGGGA